MDADQKKALHDAALVLAEALQRHGDVDLIEASLVQAWLRGKQVGLLRAEAIAEAMPRRAS